MCIRDRVKYEGTAFVVTHDRNLIETFANHMFIFEPGGGLIDFRGNYEDYLAQKDAAVPAQKKTR